MKWMHLSDIHLNKEHNHLLSNILRNELPEFIKENHITADFLFLTGDYRDSVYLGKEPEEDQDIAARKVAGYILKIAESLQVTSNHIYLVPGNHDLCRGESDSEKISKIKDLYPELRETLNDEERSGLLSRFPFYEKVYDYIHLNDNIGKNSEFIAFHQFFSEKDFDLLCLNTALTCYGRDKEGELLIDSIGVSEIMQEKEPSDILRPLVVLAHHSLNT